LRGLLEVAGLAPRQLELDGELASVSGNWVEIDDDGHVWSLGLTKAPGLDSLAPLADFSRLSRVWIQDVHLAGLDGLSGGSLSHLRIHRGGLRSLAGLEGCPALRVLDLRGNAIESLAELAELPELRVLDLAGNAISRAAGLAGRERLESLDLSGNVLAGAAGIEDLASLERLDLARNRLASLAGLRALPRLRELLVDDNQLVDASAVDALPALELVNLNGNRLERFPRLVSRTPPHLWQDNPGTRRYWEGVLEARRR
jgi:Leucine-rich repeat (LRR) protein